MTNQKLYEFRVLVYCIIIKQMLLNKRTTSENTQYQQNVWEHACTKKDACVKLSSKHKSSQGELAEEYEEETVSIKNVYNFLVYPPTGFNCDANTVSTYENKC